MGTIKILAMCETMEKIRKEINMRTLRNKPNRSFVFEKMVAMVFVSFVVSRFLFDVRWPAAPILFICLSFSERRLKYWFRLLSKWFRWNRSNRMNGNPKQTEKPRKISKFYQRAIVSLNSTCSIKKFRVFESVYYYHRFQVIKYNWIRSNLSKKNEKT